MKLIIQISCYNEADNLPTTLSCLPRNVPGFSEVEWLVVDDGSKDGTSAFAKKLGVDCVISFPNSQGLAKAFMTGLETALKHRVDVIVNLDADNQYDAKYIPDLTKPLVDGVAKIAIAARPVNEIPNFSPLKKLLQRFGSWVVRKVSGTDVADAPSGFRAMHRDAAMRTFVFNRYTYTLETIIQAGRLNIDIISVPVDVNPPTRESRFIRSTSSYIIRSMATIVRIFILYYPLRFFSLLALIIAMPGFISILRFLIEYIMLGSSGHVLSLVIGGVQITIASFIFVGGLIADLISANRVLLSEIRSRLLE